MKEYTKIEAIDYLIRNEIGFVEWNEAWMYRRIKGVIKSEKNSYSQDELDRMLDEVKRGEC